MKNCWYKAIEWEKPDASYCLTQLSRGGCETCEYYMEYERTENENAKRKRAMKDEPGGSDPDCGVCRQDREGDNHCCG